MAALIKYVDLDSTRDPDSDEEKSGKGRKNGKRQQQNTVGQNQGNNGNLKQADGGSDFVANTNMQSNNQHRRGKPEPQIRGPKFDLEAMLNQLCQKHSCPNRPSSHMWKDCFSMKHYKDPGFHQDHHNNNGPHDGSGSGSHGPSFGGGGSNSRFQGQGNQGGFNKQNNQGNQQQ